LVVAMAVTQRLQRITDLHLSSPEVLAKQNVGGASPQPNVSGLCPIFPPGSMEKGNREWGQGRSPPSVTLRAPPSPAGGRREERAAAGGASFLPSPLAGEGAPCVSKGRMRGIPNAHCLLANRYWPPPTHEPQ
jgi:hypothetical protein